VSTTAVPPEETTNSHEQSAKRAAAAIWQCKPEQTFAQDLSVSFPWIHKSSVLLLKSIDHKKMLVVVSSDGVATPFPVAKTVVALNRLFESENVELPKSMPPDKLAAAIHSFTLGPGGFVGSPAFWEAQQRSLKMWTTHSPKDGPLLFQKYCESPVLSQEGVVWKMRFYYFNDRGGVEKWSVSGDNKKIREVNSSPALPDGTFVFPYG